MTARSKTRRLASGNALLGSVIEHCVRHASCSVVVVRDPIDTNRVPVPEGHDSQAPDGMP